MTEEEELKKILLDCKTEIFHALNGSIRQKDGSFRKANQKECNNLIRNDVDFMIDFCTRLYEIYKNSRSENYEAICDYYEYLGKFHSVYDRSCE